MTDEEIKMMMSMPSEEFRQYLDKKYKAEIAELRAKGATDKDLHRNENIDRSALKAVGIKPSYLVPTAEPQMLEDEDWDCHIPYEGKWEFSNGIPFPYEGYCRDTLTMALITNMGLMRLIEILPKESIDELRKLIDNHEI